MICQTFLKKGPTPQKLSLKSFFRKFEIVGCSRVFPKFPWRNLIKTAWTKHLLSQSVLVPPPKTLTKSSFPWKSNFNLSVSSQSKLAKNIRGMFFAVEPDLREGGARSVTGSCNESCCLHVQGKLLSYKGPAKLHRRSRSTTSRAFAPFVKLLCNFFHCAKVRLRFASLRMTRKNNVPLSFLR